MKTRVSGVPYEVELGERCPTHGLEIMNFSSISETIDHYEVIISTLEQENKSMRARMNRLEEELNWRISETIDHYEVIISTLEQENKSMRARMNRLEEEVNWLENQGRHFKDDLK